MFFSSIGPGAKWYNVCSPKIKCSTGNVLRSSCPRPSNFCNTRWINNYWFTTKIKTSRKAQKFLGSSVKIRSTNCSKMGMKQAYGTRVHWSNLLPNHTLPLYSSHCVLSWVWLRPSRVASLSLYWFCRSPRGPKSWQHAGHPSPRRAALSLFPAQCRGRRVQPDD